MGKVRRDIRDPRGHHVRIYSSMIDSPAWQALTHTERSLYVAMRRKLNGSNNGNISATLATLKDDGFTSSSTLSRSLRALIVAGFIDKTRQGAIAGFGGLRHCNLFRFTDEITYEFPKKGVPPCKVTNDWQNWRSVAAVAAAIAEAHRAAKRPTNDAEPDGSQNEAELRSTKGCASKGEAIGANVSSIAEHMHLARVR